MNEIQKTEYLLAPGYIILPEEPMLIYMILGSCVAVIVFNRKVNTVGCCHFIKPRPPSNADPRPIYGSVAVATLIKLMLGKGGTIRDLEAQVIGGSDMTGRTIGKENADTAMQILSKRGVHIASKDIGGDKGRKVIFNSDNNNLAVIKVDKIRSDDWYPEEDNI